MDKYENKHNYEQNRDKTDQIGSQTAHEEDVAYQARIQEFSSGVQFSEQFWQVKKKNTTKRGVEMKSNSTIETAWFCHDCLSIIKSAIVISWWREGVLDPPPDNFWFK